MNEPIGLPVMCCIMFAVKKRYTDQDLRDLKIIACEQFERIDRRYSDSADRFSLNNKDNIFFQLDVLQKILDKQHEKLNWGALENCLLYTRNSEWFTTVEVEAALSPTNTKMAKEIADYVHQAVVSWHIANKKGDLWDQTQSSKDAWRRLVSVMNIHIVLLVDYTITVQDSVFYRLEYDLDESYYDRFDLWAKACDNFSDVVNEVIAYLEAYREGEDLFFYYGAERLPCLPELPRGGRPIGCSGCSIS